MAATKTKPTKKAASKKAGAKKAATKKAAAAASQITRAYEASISSLKGLELTCEDDEANLSAKITNLDLGTDDGTKVTVGDYEEADEEVLGELAFEQFNTDVDEQSLKAIHQTKGDTFLFKGDVFINNKPIKVLVFREN